MHTGVVTLVTAEGNAADRARWWDAIDDAFAPFGPAPKVRCVSIADAIEHAGRCAGTTVILVAEHDAPMAPLCKALDRLHEMLVPVVLLAPHGDPRFLPFGEEGAIVAHHDDHPAAIASMVFALNMRQGVVDETRRELRLLRRAQAGLTDHIDRMHEELQIAAMVQQDFLPHTLPSIEGTQLAVLFRPSGYVSGDIYDVMRLDEKTTGFFVADATGHGVPAALMTMVLSRGLHTRELYGDTEHIVRPADAVAGLNRAILRQAECTRRFATAVYGVIDQPTRRVTLAGAGHPAPLRIKPGGVIEPVETDGPMLGVFAEGEYNEASFELGDDELLLVYSDGFETAFPREGADGYGRRLPTRRYIERFGSLAGQCMDLGLDAALRSFVQDLDREAGSLHQVDDLTALLIGGAAFARAGAGRRRAAA